MAASAMQKFVRPFLINSSNSGVNLTSIRLATHRQYPTKKVNNPFVQRRTDLIKKLVIALVKHERIQTTLPKALQLKKYADLLVTLSQRRRPPPDIDMIKDGFILTEKEAQGKMVTRQIVNRRSKKVVVSPKPLPEEEYIARCRQEAANMLMGDKEALEKLHGPLKNRYQDKYGNFVHVVKIPHPALCPYPRMAYVELVGNALDPLPDMPDLSMGKRVVYGKETLKEDREENENKHLALSYS